jgi:hypothetical protein
MLRAERIGPFAASPFPFEIAYAGYWELSSLTLHDKRFV